MDSDFIEMVKQMATINVRQAPGYKTAMAIAQHPDVRFPSPVETAFAIDIEVNDDFVNDPEFQIVIDSYVKTLNNIHCQLCGDFGMTQGETLFKQMAKKMTLKYSY